MTDSPHQLDTGRQGKTPSLADLVEGPPELSLRQAFPARAAIKLAVMVLLFLAVNYWQLHYLVGIWRHDPDWSHGFLIPLFSLYMLYARRRELFLAKREVFIWALPMAVFSIAFIVYSFAFFRNRWLCELGMVGLMFVLVWYLAGTQVVRVAWLPIWFLVLAMPIPPILYRRISVPLQEFAATCSSAVLRMIGAEVGVTASTLYITSLSGTRFPLTVAEACSGMRSLMAYLALGVAWAYLEDRPIWQRVVLVIFAIPIAILCNILRVTITCSMYVVDKPDLGRDFMHEFTGMLMLVPALLMFWGLAKLLASLLVEVEDGQQDAASAGAQTPSDKGAKA